MKWIVLAAVALLAAGGGAAYLHATRTTADIDLYGLNGWRAWDGAREVKETSYPGDGRGFKGKGKAAVMLSAQNLRDHPVKLSVPANGPGRGVQERVVFVPAPGPLPSISDDVDLDRASATMPANAGGMIVHVFRVSDCRRARGLVISELELATDGHAALVADPEKETITYLEDALSGFGPVRFEGC